ncbi:MAG TPA: HDOD domain-containing protein [Azonexus sp.]
MTLMIDFPFPGLEPWVEHFQSIELPVLRHTMHQLAELRDDAERINTRKLAAVIENDPLMTLRVFQYMAAHRGKNQAVELTTVERALMMIGTQKFFTDFQDLPIIEQQLKGYPKAMLGLLKVMARSRQAAAWAKDWALLRQNPAYGEIMLAALLHDFTEILMWCFAPALATRIRERHAAAPHLRTAMLQNEEYGVVLDELTVELAGLWGLPQLLVTLMNPANANSPNVRNVKLAVDFARHTANGWHDAALPDDFREIESFLHQGHSNFLERVGAPEEMIVAARLAEESANPLASS